MKIAWALGQEPVHDHNKSELVERLVQKAFKCHISDVPEKVIIRSVLPAPVIMFIFVWAEKFFRGCPHESRKVKDGVHITISLYLEAGATDYDTIHIYLSPNFTRILESLGSGRFSHSFTQFSLPPPDNSHVDLTLPDALLLLVRSSILLRCEIN